MEAGLSCGPAGLGVMVAQEGEQVPEGSLLAPTATAPATRRGSATQKKEQKVPPGPGLPCVPLLLGVPQGAK